MRRALPYLYPVGLAAIPALSLAAGNPGEYTAADLLVTTAATLALGGIAYLVCAALLLRWQPPGVVAALAALPVAWFFYFVPLHEALAELASTRASVPAVAVVGCGVTLVLVAWLLLRRPRLEGFTRFMAVAVLVLLGATAARVALQHLRGATTPEHPLVAEMRRPIAIRQAPAGAINQPRRDVYLIVLDGYGSRRTLASYYGLDNGPFEDSLRALGFVVPRRVHSNYAQTVLSLTSLLNFRHLNDLTRERAGRGTDLERYLLEHNRTVRFFRSHGYTFVFFPSAWFLPTLQSAYADVRFRAWNSLNLNRQTVATSFRRAVRQRTLLRYVRDARVPDQQHLLRSFAGLKQVPESAAPTFTFAHIMAPHPPYMVNGECGPKPLPEGDFDSFDDLWDDARGYRDAVRCVNRQVLSLVRTLLAHPGPKPIILLVSDHGTDVLGETFLASVRDISAAGVRERLNTFGAFYLPAGGVVELRDPVTLVNLMPSVLRHYFGADVKRLSDDVFFSTYRRPHEFVSVARLLN